MLGNSKVPLVHFDIPDVVQDGAPRSTMTDRSIDLLRVGHPPSDPALLEFLTAGSDLWLDFVCERYLDTYIRQGGSKVKLLIGKSGIGKTHHLYMIQTKASSRGYLTAYVDAHSVRLHRFSNLYEAIVEQLDISGIVAGYTRYVLDQVDIRYKESSETTSIFNWYVSQVGVEAAREKLRSAFQVVTRNPHIQRTFGIVMLHLIRDYLGMRPLLPEDQSALLGWIRGEKITTASRRRFHVYERIDKENSRDALRSLLECIRSAGYAGMVVCLDGLEAIVERNSETNRWSYSRQARDDSYESIRQLIDDTDNLNSMFVLLAGRTELIQDSERGLKSYYALWTRLQNEIMSLDFNKFSDQTNLDRLLDPPQSISAEERLMLAIFGLDDTDGAAEASQREQAAIDVLSALHQRLCKAFPTEELWGRNLAGDARCENMLRILRQKGPVAPVRRLVTKTFGDKPGNRVDEL